MWLFNTYFLKKWENTFVNVMKTSMIYMPVMLEIYEVHKNSSAGSHWNNCCAQCEYVDYLYNLTIHARYIGSLHTHIEYVDYLYNLTIHARYCFGNAELTGVRGVLQPIVW